MQKYSVNQHFISTILGWVQAKEIAIPEIQRPFVWDSIKVRDLLDSLYQGFPIGYIIAWKNPDVRAKDGSISSGRKILIDGQQRVVGLQAAILGQTIINKEYQEERIRIAFNPLTGEFKTLTPAIEKDYLWIPDISELMKKDGGSFEAIESYCLKNPGVDRHIVGRNIDKLLDIKNRQVGFIELDSNLDIETVTEIFVRINSQGVVLSQADFAMSKIASYDTLDNFGVNLRKCIDYFCHLSRQPQFFKHVSENDVEFSKTNYFNQISWLKGDNDSLYDPDYGDILRVAFTYKFGRGKMGDLVSLLSGRNFETKTFEKEVMDESFQRLKAGVTDFINETNFKRFAMIIKSSGFISPQMISSQNALNFSYALYLKLRDKKFDDNLIGHFVTRWFAMSTLLGRYSASPETKFESDIKNISQVGVEKTLQIIEEGELSEAFWDIRLEQELEKSSISNPYLNIFFAAQVKNNDPGFLSKDITVADMILLRGDIHHLFPRDYLKVKGFNKTDYNQIANFVYAQQEINIKIGNKSPKEYFGDIKNQCQGSKLKYGAINNLEELKENLQKSCIPESTFEMEADHYPEFLNQRRKLMAQKVKNYYYQL